MRPEILHGLDGQRTHFRNARIVDETGEAFAAQRRRDRLGRSLHLVRFRHIKEDRAQVTGGALRQRLAIGLFAYPGKDPPAIRRQVTRGPCPDSGRGTGNDDCLHGLAPFVRSLAVRLRLSPIYDTEYRPPGGALR